MESLTLDDKIEKAIRVLVKHPCFELALNEVLNGLDEMIKEKNEVYNKYGTIFRRAKSLGDKELGKHVLNFLNYSENKHWTGMHRQKSTISKNFPALKDALVYAQENPDDIRNILKKLLNIEGVGIGTASIILHVMYPERYAPYNAKAIEAFKIVGIDKILKLQNYEDIDRYIIANRYIKEATKIIKKHIGKDFEIWEMDSVWHYIKEAHSHNKCEKYIEYSDDLFFEIEKILSVKNQMILYGPPGTGKTWIAREYASKKVEEPKYKTSIDKLSLRDDTGYYLLVMNASKYPIKNINSYLEEEFTGNVKSAFESLNEEDIAFVYIGAPQKRVYAIAKCSEKIDDHHAKFKILKIVEGPSYQDMKSEEPMMSNPGVRSMLRGTLFNLSLDEANWIASKIDRKELENLKLIETSKEEKEYNYSAFVTFHPSFSYEDFIESIKPNSESDELKFRIEEGVFKKISREAYNALLDYAEIDSSKRWFENKGLPKLTVDEKNKVKDKIKEGNFPKFYLIVDEINRGDISKIFGELITLLEKDKRLFMENEMRVKLPYSKKEFGVPPNLYIIGTMNTADRSIALMDVALRRRFAFLEIMPDMGVVENLVINNLLDNLKDLATKALDALKKVNERIRENYDRDHQIGHSYYLQLKDATTEDELESKLKYIWLYEILPLLQEYFYGSEDNLAKILYKCDEGKKIDFINCYKEKIDSNITEFLDKIIKPSST